jgi:hypothetical protein
LIDNALLHEIYVMNLLGHLKLAYERGLPEGAREYAEAQRLCGNHDPLDFLRRKVTRKLLKDGLGAGWPRDFKKLRRALDQYAAPDLGNQQMELQVTAAQVTTFFTEAHLTNLARDVGVPLEKVFRGKSIELYVKERPEWGISAHGKSEAELAQDIIWEADRGRRIGGVDLLGWTIRVLLSEEFKTALDRKYGDRVAFLRDKIIRPAAAQVQQAQAEEVEFGYGVISGQISYAALDRRLQRLQGRMTDYAKDALAECEQLHGGLRRVLTSQVAAALELEKDYRNAVGLLVGISPSRSACEEHKASDSSELEGDEGEPSILAGLHQGRDAKPADANLCLKDWLGQPGVRAAWGSAARKEGDADRLEVIIEEERPGRVGKLLKKIGFRARRRPVVVRVVSSHEVVLKLYGLDELREQVLQDRLPDATGSLSGGTLRDRILTAPLRKAPAPERYAVAYDLPQRARLLFERTLEVLNPQPLKCHKGNVLAALSHPERLLPVGSCLFRCPTTLQDLVEELKKDAKPVADGPISP